MSSGDKRNLARASFESSPVWCAHDRMTASPESAKQILHFNLKGFGGGVPQNTETAAVKPRAGIE